MRIRLIVNPVSGTQAPDQLPAINEALRSAYEQVDIAMTVGPGDGEQAARSAAEDGYRHIAVAGGDGTLNEALNGLERTGLLEEMVVGLIPMGTGNDLAAMLELPADPVEAAVRLCQGRERRIDVGLLNDRVFVNASAGGFVAEVSDAVTPGLKSVAGRLAYVIAGAGVLTDFEPPLTDARLGDERFEARHYQLFVIANGRTIGGGHVIAPRARLDDGLLDACLVESGSTTEVLGLLRKISSGEHLEAPQVAYRQFQAGELHFERPIKVNTDGEVLETRRCRYGIRPGALRILT